MQPQAELHLLGTFQFTVRGQTVTSFRSDKVRALLSWLAVESNRPHTRQVPATMFWGEYADSGALKNLRMSLSNLKKLFADAGLEAVLEISRTQLALKPGELLRCDVVDFLELTQFEDEKDDLTDAMRSRLEEAVALYRGEFLAGLSLQDSEEFSYWQSVQRELLHERINRALELLIADGWARGDDDRVQRYANRQLALSPWQEGAHRALMRSLARSGRRAEAMAHYDVCSRVLWEELGVEPSAETKALRDDIEANVESVGVSTSAEEEQPEIHHNLPSALPTIIRCVPTHQRQ